MNAKKKGKDYSTRLNFKLVLKNLNRVFFEETIWWFA